MLSGGGHVTGRLGMRAHPVVMSDAVSLAGRAMVTVDVTGE